MLVLLGGVYLYQKSESLDDLAPKAAATKTAVKNAPVKSKPRPATRAPEVVKPLPTEVEPIVTPSMKEEPVVEPAPPVASTAKAAVPSQSATETTKAPAKARSTEKTAAKPVPKKTAPKQEPKDDNWQDEANKDIDKFMEKL